MMAWRAAILLLPAVLATALCVAASGAQAQEVAVVTTRVIYPGQTVSADALREVTVRNRQAANYAYVTAAAEIDGKVARRTLLPGRFIPQGSVREPYLVETGAPVTVTYIQDGLTISLTAVPLQSGSAGDMVRMRNMDSGTVFSGVVLADGTVRVGAS